MKTNLLIIALLLVGIFIAGYLLVPTPGFPANPPDSLASSEPADTESIFRRSYFTNLTRDQVMSYYQNSFSTNFNINHPPEQGVEMIRDQTRSSWLEELYHPGKDALYINGYYPVKATDQIYRNGNHYLAKITVRYIPSSPVTRLTVLGLSGVALFWLIKEYAIV